MWATCAGWMECLVLAACVGSSCHAVWCSVALCVVLTNLPAVLCWSPFVKAVLYLIAAVYILNFLCSSLSIFINVTRHSPSSLRYLKEQQVAFFFFFSQLSMVKIVPQVAALRLLLCGNVGSFLCSCLAWAGIITGLGDEVMVVFVLESFHSDCPHIECTCMQQCSEYRDRLIGNVWHRSAAVFVVANQVNWEPVCEGLDEVVDSICRDSSCGMQKNFAKICAGFSSYTS